MELSGENGQSPNELIVIGHIGKNNEKTYVLPNGILYLNGTNRGQVTLNGEQGEYLWKVGTRNMDKVSNTSIMPMGSLTENFLAGVGYTKQPSGILIDLKNHVQFSFAADSVMVSGRELIWTKGRSVFWAALN